MLGQFLDVWQQTLTNSTAFFGSISNLNATAYVNGEKFEGDYRSIPLESLKEIVLVYGTPPANIPNNYDFGNIKR
jgi:hypothetical protein